MTDIVPELYEKIHADFLDRVAADARIKAVENKIKKGTATSADAALYSQYVGEAAGDALAAGLVLKDMPDGKLYWNIADRTVRPLMTEVHEMVNDIAIQITEIEDKKAGIGLKAQGTKLNKYRLSDLVDAIVREAEKDVG